MIQSASLQEPLHLSRDDSEENETRRVRKHGYVESISEAILGFAKLLILNGIVTEVYLLLGTMIVPLNCKTYRSGGSCDGRTSLVAYALYFQPLYMVTTVLICVQQSLMTIPLPPLNWIYAAISFTLLVAVVVPLGAGPKMCSEYPILLSIGPYTMTLTLILVSLIHMHKLLRTSNNSARQVNDCNKEEEKEHELGRESFPSSNGGVIGDGGAASEEKGGKAAISKGQEEKEDERYSHSSAPFRQPFMKKDSNSGDDDTIVPTTNSSTAPLTTKGVLASLYVPWVAFGRKSDRNFHAKAAAYPYHIGANAILSILVLGVYATCLTGSTAFIMHTTDNNGGLWSNASFVGFFLFCVNIFASLVIMEVCQMLIDHHANGFRQDFMLIYFVDLIYLVFYRVVIQDISEYSTLFSVAFIRISLEVLQSLVRFYPSVYHIEYKVKAFVLGRKKETEEEGRRRKYSEEVARFGLRTLGDCIAILITFSIRLIADYGPVYARDSLSTYNETPISILVLSVCLDLITAIVIALCHSKIYGISAFKLWHGLLYLHPAHVVITFIISIHVAGDALLLYIKSEFVY